jgi:hypothetical protein
MPQRPSSPRGGERRAPTAPNCGEPFPSVVQSVIVPGRVADSIYRTRLPAVADVADDPRWQPYLPELAQVEQVRRFVATDVDESPLTLAQAAGIVGVSTKTMYRRAVEEGSPFYKLTAKGRWQVERKALLDWVERKAAAGAPSPTPRRRRRKGKGGGMKRLDDE